jgi:hypothetical protein
MSTFFASTELLHMQDKTISSKLEYFVKKAMYLLQCKRCRILACIKLLRMYVGCTDSSCVRFFNTEFLCMYNKTYYSKMEFFVRNIEYCLDTILTISNTTSPFTRCAWAGGTPVTSRLRLWSCRINHNISAT